MFHKRIKPNMFRPKSEGEDRGAKRRTVINEGPKAMSYMKGDLLTKTRNLVKGLAKTEPLWLKAMEKFVSFFLFFNPLILLFQPFVSLCVLSILIFSS